jgi:UDP-GlcNAc:undecaprenyl-phosphate/decaprenyl-phosphate GlcNAc-1-phosphate transferase
VILLTAWGQTIGQVAVTGHPDIEPVWQKLAELTEITDGIEAVISARETAHAVEPLATAST